MRPFEIQIVQMGFKHSFCGKQFHVGTAKMPKGKIGGTTSRRRKQPLLLIDHRLPSNHPLTLETLIHEALHACMDKRMSERDVERVGHDIGRFIWKCGFRRKARK